MSCSTAGNEWALSTGNDLPVDLVINSERGEVVTGLTITGYLATEKGGAEITTPATAFSLIEDTTTSATARAYRAVVEATVVDALIALGRSSFWVAYVKTGDFLVWMQVPATKYRVLA